MCKNTFLAGVLPGPRWGAHSTPPNLLSALRVSNCKGKERRGKESNRREKEKDNK